MVPEEESAPHSGRCDMVEALAGKNIRLMITEPVYVTNRGNWEEFIVILRSGGFGFISLVSMFRIQNQPYLNDWVRQGRASEIGIKGELVLKDLQWRFAR